MKDKVLASRGAYSPAKGVSATLVKNSNQVVSIHIIQSSNVFSEDCTGKGQSWKTFHGS